jgi:hypothetical protein
MPHYHVMVNKQNECLDGLGVNQFLNTSNESYVVPEGHPRIARRFNAGTRTEKPLSPEGTAEDRLLRPFGTDDVVRRSRR